jgi:hypothetical protein
VRDHVSHLYETEGYLDLKGEDGSWKKLHNYELHNLYSSLNIVRVIKSRRMM